VSIEFTQPLVLLLLAAVPLAWILPRRTGRTAVRTLRLVVLSLVVIALAGPVLISGDATPHHVLVLDRSAGISAEKQSLSSAVTARWRAQAPGPQHSSIVLLGASGGGADWLEGAGVTVLTVSDPVSKTPFSAALAAAARRIPAGSPGVVTVVSDGLSTDRRWGPVVQDLTERGIPVAAFDLGVSAGDIYPARLIPDGMPRAGHTARVLVEVLGLSAGVAVRLTDDTGRVLAFAERRPATGRVLIPLEFEPEAAGFLPLRAEVMAEGDADTGNNTLSTVLAVQSPRRVLYLGARITGAAARLGSLLGPGFQLTVVEGGAELPDPADHDLILIDDRPAGLVSEQFQRQVAAAVRRGALGLLFTGGRAAFGTGGYEGTPLAEILPVDFIQRTEKRDPSTALAVIIDTSSSMMGTRIELAKQVTRLAIRRLKAHDRVGIVEFYGNKHWALPLQSAANKIAIDRAIGRMQATGGTVMYPAMEEAYYGLKNVSTRYKHVLIITDAGVEDADYESLVRLMARDNVNVSTVLVGAGAHSQSLIDIATWGRGRFYSASDRYSLPELVLKQSTTMNLPAYREGMFPVRARGGAAWWGDLDREALPALSGYVETGARPGAEVPLETADSAHPVLASWQHGAGRVTVLATEPVGGGTAGWQAWNGYGRWLARVAARTAGDGREFDFSVSRRDHEIVLETRRLDPPSGSRPRVGMLDAEGRETGSVDFHAIAPGLFRAVVPAHPDREVRFSAGGGAGGNRPLQLIVSPAAEDVVAERQVDPARRLDLSALAAATGGVHHDLAEGLPTALSWPSPAEGRASPAATELWPWAALLALLVWIAEVALRRLPERP